MDVTAANESAIERFASSLDGRLVRPHDGNYDEARAVWNGMADKRPDLIARCHSESDVVRAVDFAREQSLPVTVRAGGHSVAGKSTRDGGLIIDLSSMNRVEIDPVRRLARVQGGALGRDLDGAAQEHGLATTLGTDSTTGVAGLALGGGIGFLARSCGLATDNIVAADVVLADGSRVRASGSENSDLLWALKGGGGDFGVVTSFDFRLHPVGPEVLVAQIFHPFEQAEQVFRFYRDYMADAPDEVGCYALVVNVPPVEPFPESHHGKSAVALVAAYNGPVDEGRAAFEPLAQFGDPMLNAVQPMPYAALQQSFDAGFPSGKRYFWKSHYLSALSDGAIETIVRHAATLPGPYSAAFLEPMGGAINRPEISATAYPHRSAAFNLGISAGWDLPEDDASAIAWTRRFYEEMQPYSNGGVYVNYLDRDDGARVDEAFGQNLGRLRQIKAKYDPNNFFDATLKGPASD